MSSLLARSKEHIHPVVFPVAAGTIIAFVLYGAVFNEDAESRLVAVRTWITATFGWFMIASIAALLLFCLWLIIGRYGQVKLGPDDSTPDYSYLTWFAMLFSAGMGIGLVFWGVAEPIFHFAGAPRVESETAIAAQEAMLLTFHHWGLGAWSVYAVLGLSLAYFGYRHGLPMTVRSALYPLIGDRMNGWAGNLVDTLAIFGTMFGVATSLGLGVTQVNAGLNRVFDVPVSQGNQVMLIAVITLAATISVMTGIDKGIRRLSEINITAAGLLMLFVAITGPTLVLVSVYGENLGNYVTNFVELLFWSGGYDNEHEAWLSGWTIFYWAWWISWAPFVGTFIARISRGRTIREFVLGVLIVPSLVSFAWFTVMGNTALDVELEGTGDIIGPTFEATEFAMFALLEQLPLTTLTSVVTIFVIVAFFVTSSDSASYVIDMIASGGNLNPPVAMRVFWAVSEGVVAAVLLYAGGLDALQAAAIATGLPFAVVILISMVGIMKGLRSEHPGTTLAEVVSAPLFEGSSDRREARTRAPSTQLGEGSAAPQPDDGPEEDTSPMPR